MSTRTNTSIKQVNTDKEKVAFSVREYKRKQQRDEISQYMSNNDDDGDGAYTLGELLNTKKND